MSTIAKVTTTECMIAIDEDSDEEINCDRVDDNDIDIDVVHVLDSVITSVSTLSEVTSIETTNDKTNVVIETSDIQMNPIDDNVLNDELFFYDKKGVIQDVEDEEEEDCMVIDELTTRLEDSIDQLVVDSDDDDIQLIEMNKTDVNTNDKNVIRHDIKEKVEQKIEEQIDSQEVIVLSDDDEEECLVINNTFTSKLNQLTQIDGTFRPKYSSSPVSSSSSLALKSEPGTSSGVKRVVTYVDTDSPKISTNVYQPMFKSSFLTNFKNTINESKDDESIPFLYNEPNTSTSSDFIGSSNVDDMDIIANLVKLDRKIVQNVLNLIDDQCTVPFIARYRQSAISGIDADKVRRINNIYNELKKTKERVKEVESTLAKQSRLNTRLSEALRRCRNVYEVEHLYRLCRNESQSSERYRNLGLGDSAVSVLNGKRLDPNHFVNRFASELDNPQTVEIGWSEIIADILSKDCDVLEFLIATYKQNITTLEVEENLKKINELIEESSAKNIDLIQKYRNFRSFKKPIDKMKAHTYMAIERGEELGILEVSIGFQTIVLNKLIDFCIKKWFRCPSDILVNCVKIAFNTQLKPSLSDYIRWELRYSSHTEALDVFRNNVKYLLLEPPLRGEYVIGVDPGIDSGCKVALVSPWGVPLHCKKLNLNNKHNCETAAAQLREMMIQNNCSIIALGNGTGCRRFEDMLQIHMKCGFFKPLNIKYKIINESGVSYYSVTKEAKLDLPHYKPDMIGAISIARRLIDPMNELVKVDPKRLQVGMYMRDIPEEAVRQAFNEVTVECVSFCGVDVNVASPELLSKVAALEPTIANIIVKKREQDGLFTSRSQLRNINGITWKQFEQCAGFIKVMPSTRRSPFSIYTESSKESNDGPDKRLATSTDDYDPLDSTIIHPESYSCANIYLELIGANKREIGKPSIRDKIKKCYEKYSLSEIAQLCNTMTTNMKIIIEGLSNSIDFDYRTNFTQIYLPEIKHFNDLKEGMQLKGRVVNVTPMGAFIDCGINNGINAYLHTKDCQKHAIAVNDNVLVKIISIEKLLQRFKVVVINVTKNNIKFI
ncbi:S1 RNA-binding domain-containing protein 1-like [Oppia nitens]|uniref:S1 RNA-binding domain-containing protein 1-like n=1 Tax=Oppia nitens TaxID=1686743 RepID=UPI0023DC0A08|nr:S1 RNA-binding domain-containing protein 1-like [Oppia nitens]